MTGDSSADSRSYTQVNDHTLTLDNKKDGKTVTSGKIVVSKDGKYGIIDLPKATVTIAEPLVLSGLQMKLDRKAEWTRRLVEQIFASHLEDWPAVLKSLRTVGDDIRARTRAAMATEQKASLQ